MEDSILAPYVASDGENIAIQDWPLAGDIPLRGVVLLVHGLGEHAGRYEQMARRLNESGFAVRGYDHYGHGESSGVRGGIPSDDRLLADLAEIIETTRRRIAPGIPLILFGHSMGGVVAARLVALMPRLVDALVLSSPALVLKINAAQRLLLALLWRMAPDWPIGNGIHPKWLSHDPQVVQAYRGDKQVHRRVSARLVKSMQDAGARTLAQASQWTVPTLLLYAGADRIVSPDGSRQFAAAAPQAVVTAHGYDAMFHEIFNETERETVLNRLMQWLDERF